MQMQKYAHIQDGTVVQIIEIEDGSAPIQDRYHYSIIENSILLSGSDLFSVKPGWKHDGASFFQEQVASAPPPGPRYVSVPTIRERMEAAGKWDVLVGILQSDPPTMMKVLTLRDGIDSSDQQARMLIAAAGADPDIILAE